jgi:hypothetical protein
MDPAVNEYKQAWKQQTWAHEILKNTALGGGDAIKKVDD